MCVLPPCYLVNNQVYKSLGLSVVLLKVKTPVRYKEPVALGSWRLCLTVVLDITEIHLWLSPQKILLPKLYPA